MKSIDLIVAPCIDKSCFKSNIAYINQNDLSKIKLTEKLISIDGSRKIVSLFKINNEVSEGTIQLPKLTRENAGAAMGDLVTITTGCAKRAEIVKLIPFVNKELLNGKKGKSLKKSFWFSRKKHEDNPVKSDISSYSFVDSCLSSGDRLEVIIKEEAVLFEVRKTIPEGYVVTDKSTKIEIEAGNVSNNSSISFSSIGGLRKEVERVREMVELPLRTPHLFKQLGVDPPKGLLLYGPPGCGKTLIARAVCYESNIHFIHLNGPEIIQKHYGESEELLRKVFHEAKEHPASVIFFDEIDAIAPNRETVLGDVEKRVVSQLLTLMDGLRSRGNIILIGATNIPNKLDPALRRPGRFDREIMINPPDIEGRFEILRIHTRNMPLNEDVNLGKIAASTHGFFGADLAALCREAAMISIRSTKNDVNKKIESELSVSMEHFRIAINEVQISSTRDVSNELIKVSWEEVGGLFEIKNLLYETVEWPLKYKNRFEYANTNAAKGILLSGPSGTGKTLAVRALASESEVNFISVKGPELLSKWVGDSEKGIRDVFRKARQSAPSILFFDEIDSIVPARGRDNSGSQIGERIVGQFLLEMDNIDTFNGVVVIAATNRKDLIDKALLRAGRFEIVADFKNPDKKERLEILKIHTKKTPIARNVNFSEIADKTELFNGAEIASLCRRAAMYAVRESISVDKNSDFNIFYIEQRHFESALEKIMTQKSI